MINRSEPAPLALLAHAGSGHPFFNYVHTMRLFHGWSQVYLARRAHVGVRAIYELEQVPIQKDKFQAPTIRKVCRAFGYDYPDRYVLFPNQGTV